MKIEKAIEILKELSCDLEQAYSEEPEGTRYEVYLDNQMIAITTILAHINPPKAKNDEVKQVNLTIDKMYGVYIK